MLKYIFIIVLLLVFTFNSFSQSRQELQNRKLAAQKELSTAKSMLSNTTKQKQNTLKRLSVLNSSIRSREYMLSTIDLELIMISDMIDSLNRTVDSLELSIKKGRNEYAELVLSVYKNHTDEETIMYLLASDSFNEFYQRIKYVKYLNDYRENKVKELEALLEDYDSRLEALKQKRTEKEKLQVEKSTERKELLNEKSRRSSLVQRLAQDERKIRQQITKSERISKELDDKIQAMIEAETRKSAGKNLLASLTPEQKIVGQSFQANMGRLPWPVERGVITTKFGLINHPVLTGVKIPNNGVDISSSEGMKARAVFDGEVTGVSAILGANIVVLIMHGEYISVYQNLINLKVKVGDKVKAKQEIGTIHSDPDDGVAVLQFQIRKQRDPLNPEEWLSK